jgi:hypothetical protein
LRAGGEVANVGMMRIMDEPKEPSRALWAAPVLDSIVAPEMSQVTTCSAPDISEPQVSFATYFLRNALLGPTYPDRLRPPANVYLRRWTLALSEYRAGRECLSKYVAGLPQTNNQTGLFLSAVGHFEHSVIDAYLALMAMTAFVRQIGDDEWKPFQVEDGSTADRLNKLYNVIKHFDDRFQMGQKLGHPSVYPAPVWITNNGLAGHTTLVNGKEFKGNWTRLEMKDDVRHQDVLVTFDEFATLLRELTEYARLIIEGPTAPDPPEQQERDEG